MNLEIKFVKEDCWIGVYWKRLVQIAVARPDLGEIGPDMGRHYRKVYVCLIPCFPIIFETRGKWKSFADSVRDAKPPKGFTLPTTKQA